MAHITHLDFLTSPKRFWALFGDISATFGCHLSFRISNKRCLETLYVCVVIAPIACAFPFLKRKRFDFAFASFRARCHAASTFFSFPILRGLESD